MCRILYSLWAVNVTAIPLLLKLRRHNLASQSCNRLHLVPRIWSSHAELRGWGHLKLPPKIRDTNRRNYFRRCMGPPQLDAIFPAQVIVYIRRKMSRSALGSQNYFLIPMPLNKISPTACCVWVREAIESLVHEVYSGNYSNKLHRKIIHGN